MEKTLEDLLQPHRKTIDRIDKQLLELLNQRAKTAQAIGELKGNTAVYCPEREATILSRIKKNNPGPLSDTSIMRLFREIISECLALEKPLQVAYLGPEGTFSHEALRMHFGQATHSRPTVSIEDAFQLCEQRSVDYLVVPVENSTEGAVGNTLDCLVTTSLLIQGELDLPVHHQLLSCAQHLHEIKSILAHPQALAQCRQWLQRHLPQADLVPVSSNAEGVKQIKQMKNMAASASKSAADIYQIGILARNIGDKTTNTTRFLVLGHGKTQPTGRDKTSLILSVPNQPGKIYKLLELFSRYKISMTRLESRPSHSGLWEYLFFIDIEGHILDQNVSLALTGLKKRAAFMMWLGSYPMSML